MKNKLTFLLICGIAMMMAACSGSSKGKPMSGDKLTEYNETVAKVQQKGQFMSVRKTVRMWSMQSATLTASP